MDKLTYSEVNVDEKIPDCCGSTDQNANKRESSHGFQMFPRIPIIQTVLNLQYVHQEND